MVHIPKQKRRKWDSKSKDMIFTGYYEYMKGYRLICPKTKKLVKSRDVVFNENIISNLISNHSEQHNINLDKSESVIFFEDAQQCPKTKTLEVNEAEVGEFPSESIECIDYILEEQNVRKSSRISKLVQMDDFVLYSSRSYKILEDPLTVEDALQRLEASKCNEEAMEEEFNSLQENYTSVLTDLSSNRKPINCKSIFKTKRDGEGNILRYKTRLVIKG